MTRETLGALKECPVVAVSAAKGIGSLQSRRQRSQRDRACCDPNRIRGQPAQAPDGRRGRFERRERAEEAVDTIARLDLCGRRIDLLERLVKTSGSPPGRPGLWVSMKAPPSGPIADRPHSDLAATIFNSLLGPPFVVMAKPLLQRPRTCWGA